jgi:hypothetical protein
MLLVVTAQEVDDAPQRDRTVTLKLTPAAQLVGCQAPDGLDRRRPGRAKGCQYF